MEMNYSKNQSLAGQQHVFGRLRNDLNLRHRLQFSRRLPRRNGSREVDLKLTQFSKMMVQPVASGQCPADG